MSFVHSPKIVTNGLIMCVDTASNRSYISGNSNTWINLAGTGNNGNLGFTNVTGSRMGLVLNAGTQFIPFPSNDFKFGTGNFSINAWANPATGGSPAIFGVAASVTQSRYALGFQFFSPNYAFCFIKDDNSNQVQIYSDPIIQNNWYNICMVANRQSNLSLYVNGKLNSQAIATGVTGNINPLGTCMCGGVVNGSGPNYSGMVSNISVYNRALSNVEIKQNFDALRGRFGV